MTIGKQVNIRATLENQSNVPKWNKIPVHLREKYQQMQQQLLDDLARSPEATVVDVEATSGQTDEQYFGEKEP